LLCCFFGNLFLCLALFLWSNIRDLSASSLLSECYDGLLIVFEFCSIIWVWMLLTGSGNELCGLLSALFQAVAYHPPAVSPSAFPVLVYWRLPCRSAPYFSPFCGALTAPYSLCFIFLVYYSVLGLFFVGQGVSLSKGLCWFIPGVAVGIPHDSHLLTFWSESPKQVGASLWWCWNPVVFSMYCGIEKLCTAGVSRCRSFDSSWCFLFLPHVALVSQQDLWFTELMLSASAH
jgi:hypothetical protein